MAALGVEFKPRYAAMADAAAAAELRRRLGAQTEVLDGAAALSELAAHPDADQVMSAIVGAVGLLPTLSAVRAGKRVLIANKEPLVMAGRLLMQEAVRAGATLLPVDSEHNAIFQRSEEHTSELQSLMRISYAVFCLKKKNTHKSNNKE